MRVISVPCYSDNYAYLVVCDETNQAAIVDASEAAPVLKAVREAKIDVKAIWSTHHHPDHVGGNEEVAKALGITDIAGHVSDRGRIPGQTAFVDTGDVVTVGTIRARAMHIPGHTLGAVAYFIASKADSKEGGAVFTGDTLFLAGCGRIFEGTPAQMHASLTSLAALDPRTQIYCGHEYTVSNLRFAQHCEPSNAAVKRAAEEAGTKRGAGQATVPGTIAHELETNPFLRAKSAEIRGTLGIDHDADDVTAFAAIRRAKDGFK